MAAYCHIISLKEDFGLLSAGKNAITLWKYLSSHLPGMYKEDALHNSMLRILFYSQILQCILQE